MVPQDALGPGIVTLLTDFGQSDAYAGVMKGVILARAPSARVIDLTHEVAPQAIEEAAFLLETAWRFFPAGAVHLVVVDPGVGAGRRRIALESGGQMFVGPDNGVLSAALPEASRGRRQPGAGYEARPTALPPDVSAVLIENESLFLQPVSATFEGRDVFAPVAAYLAQGGALSDLGPPAVAIEALPAFRAPKRDGAIDGLVLRADRFGNLITDILTQDLPPRPVFTIAGRELDLASAYGAASGLCAVAGSSGRIEVAMPNGSASLVLGAGSGDRVVVTSNR